MNLEKLKSVLYTLDRISVCGINNVNMMSGCMQVIQEMIEENHKKDAEKSASRKYKFTGKLFCCDCGWRFKKRVQNGISY